MNADSTYYSGNGYLPPPCYSEVNYHPYPSTIHHGLQIHHHSPPSTSEQQLSSHSYRSDFLQHTSHHYSLRRDSLFNQFDMMRLTRTHHQSPPSFTSRQNHYNLYRPYPTPSPTPFYLNQTSLCGGQAFDSITFSGTNSSDFASNSSSKVSRKEKNDKICGVCGDRALSYNFDAISCESCKAFFRRNAPKNLDYFKCPYDERCRMDVSNRRFCKRCRLKKCFEIGMRREYILTDEEKALKRQKIEANRYKMLMRQNSDNGVTSLNLGDVTSQTSALRGEDSNAIDELLAAYKMSLDTNCCDDVIEVWSRDQADMADLVNIAELSMRRVISMTKQVSAFRALPQEDQIQLLKTGSIELLILRSVITFDKEKKHFLDPLDPEESRAMKLDQLRQAENGTGLFEDHMKFIWSLVFDLKADETVLIILLMMTLFSSDRENIQNREYVAAQQERYCTLLKKYLTSKYSVSVARQLYPKFILKLTDIRSLNEEHTHVLLKLNPQGIQPLMKEVLDLCH